MISSVGSYLGLTVLHGVTWESVTKPITCSMACFGGACMTYKSITKQASELEQVGVEIDRAEMALDEALNLRLQKAATQGLEIRLAQAKKVRDKATSGKSSCCSCQGMMWALGQHGDALQRASDKLRLEWKDSVDAIPRWRIALASRLGQGATLVLSASELETRKQHVANADSQTEPVAENPPVEAAEIVRHQLADSIQAAHVFPQTSPRFVAAVSTGKENIPGSARNSAHVQNVRLIRSFQGHVLTSSCEDVAGVTSLVVKTSRTVMTCPQQTHPLPGHIGYRCAAWRPLARIPRRYEGGK